VCVCECVFTCACVKPFSEFTFVWLPSSTCVCVCMRACVRACMCVRVFVRVHVCVEQTGRHLSVELPMFGYSTVSSVLQRAVVCVAVVVCCSVCCGVLQFVLQCVAVCYGAADA